MGANFASRFKANFFQANDLHVLEQHVEAGLAFNQVISNLSLSSYFAKGVGNALRDNQTIPGEWAAAPAQLVDMGGYIVPGNIPKTDLGCVLYWLIYQSLEHRDESIEQLSRAVNQYGGDARSTELLLAEAGEGTSHHAD